MPYQPRTWVLFLFFFFACSAFSESLDFGGMYGYVDGSAVVNSVSGTWGCPAGYTSQRIRGYASVDRSGYYCYRIHQANQAPAAYFGGMFGVVDGVATVNPATGLASCPAGYSSQMVARQQGFDYRLTYCYHLPGSSFPKWGFYGMMGKVAGTTGTLVGSFNPITLTLSCPSAGTQYKVMGTSGIDYPVWFCLSATYPTDPAPAPTPTPSPSPSSPPPSYLAYQVTVFNDPRNLLTSTEHDGILSNLAGAIVQWGQHLDGTAAPNINIDIEVGTTSSGRFAGSPSGWVFRNTVNNLNVFESCASYKLRTGTRGSNCSVSDITIYIEPDYLRQNYYIDPDPYSQTSTVPSGKIDLVTALAHEFGHGLGMAGWRDLSTGSPTGQGISVYDSFISTANPSAPVFSGSATTAVYGSPMPIYSFNQLNTVLISHGGVSYQVIQNPSQNIYHYGRFTSSTSDNDLTFFGLMAGSWVRTGRIPVGALDFAIMQDLGMPVR